MNLHELEKTEEHSGTNVNCQEPEEPRQTEPRGENPLRNKVQNTCFSLSPEGAEEHGEREEHGNSEEQTLMNRTEEHPGVRSIRSDEDDEPERAAEEPEER
jgi:hypothetical protein